MKIDLFCSEHAVSLRKMSKIFVKRFLFIMKSIFDVSCPI